ncbi:MAG: ABC transporter permease [Candidatus Aminicenantes bacterium]|nr:ABC transporter permease [Candidatus Aminicenantes bacterium]
MNMFNLEKAVREWKKTLFRSQYMEEADVAELESHVRDETARLVKEGLDEEAAFRKAIEDPDAAEALDAEYAKIRRLRIDRPAWHPSRLLPSLAWSHLKIALRKMRKQKAYSFINIVGLAFGMTCSILIFFWVRDELDFNRFHEKADRLFRVNKTYQIGSATDYNSSTPFPLAGAARESIAEVSDATRFYRLTALIKFEDKVFYERRVCVTDPSFFEMFTFPFVMGDPAEALKEPNSIVVTESTASKYFGRDEPVGKTLTLDQDKSFVIKGVIKDFPSNSDFRFDLFVPASGMIDPALLEDWGAHYTMTFALLQRDAVPDEVAKKLSGLIQGQLPEEKISLLLQPIGDIHLYSPAGTEEGMKYIRIFSVIAIFILVIACINYINLSTARSEKRAKEVGLRKVVGARRAQIAWQFFAESMLFTLIALGLALLLIQTLQGVFRDLTGKTLGMADFEPGFIAGLILITAFTGIASGVYPALVLSSFKPVRALRDSLDRPGRKASFRKTLVVVQVSLTIMLLIGMGVIEQQMRFIRTRDLGFEKDNVLYMRMAGGLRENYEAFRNDLLRNPDVAAVARSYQIPGEMSAIVRGLRWEGMEPGESVAFGYIPVDFDTMDLLDMKIAQGRKFSREFPADDSNFILNEKAVEVMGLKDPIGKPFSLNEDSTGTIVGVVKDFHSMPLNFGLEPVLLIIDSNYYNLVLVKIGSGDRRGAISGIEAAWNKFAPGFPFEYHFLDERFDLYYSAEILARKIFRYFVLIAVFISCLGLLGLSAFVAEQKTKEIGIRKALGASVPRIILLLTKQFLLWVLLANMIAWPVAYVAMRSWLDNYPFRTHLGLPLFLLSAAAALVVAMLTVSFQAVRAARVNPVDSLRYE